MKKYLILFFVLPLVLCCSSDEVRNNNPYIPGINFSYDIDLTLPAFNNLLYTANPVRITTDGYGVNGLLVMNTGGGYVAFENSCPNQELSDCSVLQLDGILAKCPCDGIEYSLFTGQPTTTARFGLKSYRIQVLSSTAIRVYN